MDYIDPIESLRIFCKKLKDEFGYFAINKCTTIGPNFDSANLSIEQFVQTPVSLKKS
jgi:hypothetical protein